MNDADMIMSMKEMNAYEKIIKYCDSLNFLQKINAILCNSFYQFIQTTRKQNKFKQLPQKRLVKVHLEGVMLVNFVTRKTSTLSLPPP